MVEGAQDPRRVPGGRPGLRARVLDGELPLDPPGGGGLPGGANTARIVLTFNVPSRIKNSPTKPLRVGKPIEDIVMIMKIVAYSGITFARPPYSAIIRLCRRS